MRRLIPYLLTVLAACGATATPDRTPEGNRSAKEVAYIATHEDLIRAKLKDPSAAQFRNVRVYYAITPTVCGEVNAPSSFGGRVGFQRFISAGDLQVLEEQMLPGDMEKTWAQVCH